MIINLKKRKEEIREISDIQSLKTYYDKGQYEFDVPIRKYQENQQEIRKNIRTKQDVINRQNHVSKQFVEYDKKFNEGKNKWSLQTAIDVIGIAFREYIIALEMLINKNSYATERNEEFKCSLSEMKDMLIQAYQYRDKIYELNNLNAMRDE